MPRRTSEPFPVGVLVTTRADEPEEAGVGPEGGGEEGELAEEADEGREAGEGEEEDGGAGGEERGASPESGEGGADTGATR
jgi:hypothetical protein